MNTINKKIKIFITVIVILNVLAIGVYSFFIQRLIQKDNDIIKIVNNLNILLEEEEEIDVVKKILKTSRDDLNKIESSFVETDNVIRFLEKIESLENKAKVKLTLSSIDVEDQKGKTLSLNFKAEGRFDDIFYLMLLIENLPFKTDFDKMHLRKLDEKDSKFMWQGSFKLNLLSFINKK